MDNSDVNSLQSIKCDAGITTMNGENDVGIASWDSKTHKYVEKQELSIFNST
jgi:hypothetical protein